MSERDINISFGDYTYIEKMFDIHDNQNVTINASGLQQTRKTTTDVESRNGKQGKQPSALFQKDGNRTIEDEERRKKEKDRLCGYISAHHLGGRMLTSKTDDLLNKSIVCFCYMWKQKKWVSAEMSAPALRRFLADDCQIGLSVDEKSFEGVIRKMIGEPYDAEVFGSVKECFTNKD